jgi:Holliday junction resolvasome RuvABC endonuclease subunit
MKIIGIEIASNIMNYVVIEKRISSINICSANRIVLTDTRSRESLTAFQNAVKTLYNSYQPTKIGIKEKPETGKMKAGAAAMKMEGIILANATCDVDFVSGQRVNKSSAKDDSLYDYFQPALKTADAVLNVME